MSMTRQQLPRRDDYPINPAIPEDAHRHIRHRIELYRDSLDNEPLYGVADAGHGVYVTDGGYYDYRAERPGLGETLTIEFILSVRPPPKTSHSNWSNP